MKTLSIFIFLTFLLCLSVKLYSSKTEKMLRLNLTARYEDDIFEIGPNKARELLDSLDAVAYSDGGYQKNAPSKAQTESRTNTLEQKQSVIEEIQKLKEDLILAFKLPEDNIDDLYEIQSDIREKREKVNMLPKSLETWSPDFIFYLVIKDGYSLEGIDNINGVRDLGYDVDELVKIKRLARSDNFMLEILLYKNAISDEEYDQTLATLNPKNTDGETEDISERSIASNNQFDEYSNGNEEIDLESKLLEENYDSEELEEIKYGYNDDSESNYDN